MVASYMWRFRRSDANLRNEWSNYSNWAYDNVFFLYLLIIAGLYTGFMSVYYPNTIFYYHCLHPERTYGDILMDLAIVIGWKI